MRGLVLIAATSAAISTSLPAMAEETFVGRELQISDAGLPFCIEQSELSEYLQAMVKGDQQWLSQLKSCGMLPATAKVIGLEDLPSESSLGHVLKIRIFAKDQSTVAYTITLGLTAKQ